jgi:cytochrome b pre-mRNA-processing protein 3
LLGLFRREDPVRRAARLLYEGITARARDPVFFTRFNVTDGIDGRFDLFTLHAFLVLEALKRSGEGARAAGEQLANLVFSGFEQALRELGHGDAGVSRRIKAMANAFYGRLAAYESADSEQQLATALTRNLYRGAGVRGDEALALAHYMFDVRARLRGQDLSEGRIDFGPLPLASEKANA